MDDRQGGDISYRDMVANIQDSPVKDFYEGSTIFVTGATGFMGKILIEKILRTCPGVNKIIVLARAKKGKEISKRFEEQFSDVVYERLKLEQPDFMSKLSFISGDVGSLNLGMNEEDYEMVCREANVIFHMAATVRFDERLQLAVRVNVRGTREVLLLARRTQCLKAFLHVSTAFSNCVVRDIQEIFYDPPVSADNLMNLVEILDDETLNKITPGLLGDFPNTYAYTKVAAEDVVKEMSKGLPVAMIRPSIIIGTAKEPVQGWIDNVYGPTGVVVGAGLGLLHSLHCDPEVIADIIPVDYVINACLVVAYEIGKIHDVPNKERINGTNTDTSIKNDTNEVPIYNYVSSNDRPINWREFMRYIEKYGLDVPTIFCIWAYSFRLTKNYYAHMIYIFFTHIIPAYIFDLGCYCVGKKPKLVKAYQKIHKFSGVIAYFCTQRWYFHTQNTRDLCKSISPGDKALFDFDIANLNWEDYFYTYIRGIRVYLIKDPLESLSKAKRRYRLLQVAHYSLCTIIVLGLLRFFWLILSFFF